MEQKRVVVTVKDGKVQVDAQNFHGVGCAAITDLLQSQMGIVPTRSVDKPEMYESCEREAEHAG